MTRVTKPTRLTRETADAIVTAIKTGATLEVAAAYAGIGRRTFFDWLREGRRPDGRKLYRDFVDELDLALGQWEAGALQRIHDDPEWQSDAWMLERRFPDRYGRRTRIDSTVTVAARPFIDVSKLTLEEQETLLMLLRKAAPGDDQLPVDGRAPLELLPGLAEEDA